jgi:hypothetical protein
MPDAGLAEQDPGVRSVLVISRSGDRYGKASYNLTALLVFGRTLTPTARNSTVSTESF